MFGAKPVVVVVVGRLLSENAAEEKKQNTQRREQSFPTGLETTYFKKLKKSREEKEI